MRTIRLGKTGLDRGEVLCYKSGVWVKSIPNSHEIGARYATRSFPRSAFMAMKNRRCTSVSGTSPCCCLSPG